MQRSPAHTTPWECYLPSCASRRSAPRKRMRAEQGGRKQSFLCFWALSPNTTCESSLSLESLFPSPMQTEACHHRKTLKEFAFSEITLVWRPFLKHLCCGRRNTGVRGPPSWFCHEPAGWLWEHVLPPCASVSSSVKWVSECPMRSF